MPSKNYPKLINSPSLQYPSLFSCGIDEAGRGPLAGPVVAAAVILQQDRPITGLNDSKKLNGRQREQLRQLIIESAVDYQIVAVDIDEIAEFNILGASLLAMQRAFESLSSEADSIWVDGNKLPAIKQSATAVVGGDGKIAAIAAASILAKTTRDQIMQEMHLLYPQYGFDQHKGYPTKAHFLALSQFGPCPIHRMTFAPLVNLSKPQQQSLF